LGLYTSGDKTLTEVIAQCYEGTDYVDATFSCKIPGKHNDRVFIAATHPNETTALYEYLQRVLFEYLLGIESSTKRKKSLPRPDPSVFTNGELSIEAAAHFEAMFGSDRYTLKPPPLGQAFAALMVTEEQQRTTLHGHLIAWTTALPEVLQSVAGHTYLQECVSRLLSAIIKAEIPPTLHVQDSTEGRRYIF
jgi:hypothetical protein